MKAAQFFGQNDIRITSISLPTPQDHEALIALSWCGICGSDIHEYLHGPLACPLPSSPHPLTKSHIPVTLGHEFSGRILSAPPEFPELKPGTPVAVNPTIFCRKCGRCKEGNTNGCGILGFKGLSGGGGGFSERICVDARLCYALPEDVDLRLAALVEPLAVGWHAVATAGVSDWEGQSVLVLGGGPVGVATILVLRVFGCKTVVVSEPTEVRKEQVKSIADVVLDPVKDDVGEKCRELTGGEGVDVVFDCAGNQNGFVAGMDALRFRGTYMNVALWLGSPMQIPFMSFMLKEITLKCSLAYDEKEFKDVVDAFVSGRFKGIESMITSKISVDDVVSKGFDELITNKDRHVKILVTPDPSKV